MAQTRRSSQRVGSGQTNKSSAGLSSAAQRQTATRSRTAAQPKAGLIRSSLTFGGTWRSYQARVLEAAQSYMEDGRIHIVAAPGSGKTTLGIELIGRADAPCLIFAPSITIREQWLDRIREGFGAPKELLSNDIKNSAPITAITYQALHSCLKRRKNVEEDESGKKEETDYTRFDLYETLEKAGIKTFCLDEAHHLRSEWQKALEEVVGKFSDHTIISLTATPPYDSTPAQWNRYISLCGPIDEEISVPELVKEGSLCPHQDFVYFNMPTPEEEAQLKKFRKESERAYKQLLGDKTFAGSIMTHGSFEDAASYLKLFNEKRKYLLALLSFAQEKGQQIPRELLQLAGEELEVPPMDMGLLADLLQGFLFEDGDSYDCDPAYREALINQLKNRGLIHKNVVELQGSSEMDKMLTNSRGKLKSICSIVNAEYKSMGQDLRLLILTDFIRSEHLSAIGDLTESVEEMGVVPIFEKVRRSCQPPAGLSDLRLAALSGSVVILPECAREAFYEIAERNGQKAALKPCGAAGYYQVSISGNGPRLTAYLTELFGQGYIRVLVGTKSLLGEGWDSPCINSLVLASFVGSFMLSNQMRGRAIRTMKGNPDKASNIWHLICMEPVWTEKRDGEKNGRSMESLTADFTTLRRRFDGFLGVNYEKDRIESGLDRLTYIRPPYGNAQLDEINEKMIALADDRPGLIERWQRSLDALEDMETVEGVGASEKVLKSESQRTKYSRQKSIAKIGMLAAGAAAAVLALGGHLVLGAAAACGAVYGFFKMKQNQKSEDVFSDPEQYMGSVSCGVLSALQQMGLITSKDVSVEVETSPAEDRAAVDAAQSRQSAAGNGVAQGTCFACLRGGTEREKSLFADTLSEFLGDIRDQRYLIEAVEALEGDRLYYPVPEVFGKRKADAELFASCVAPYTGGCELIFTRSEEGKKILLKVGVQQAASEEDNSVVRHKRVQNRN